MRRRALLLSALAPALVRAADAPPTLAMLGFELVDEHPEVSHRDVLDRRLALIDGEFRRAVDKAGLYRVVDTAPAAERIARLRSEIEFLYRCNGCLAPIGRAVGAQYVAAGWVQKVSNLILNINIEVLASADDRVALVQSVDLRGNTDLSWSRGVAYLVGEMADRRARNPRYGL